MPHIMPPDHRTRLTSSLMDSERNVFYLCYHCSYLLSCYVIFSRFVARLKMREEEGIVARISCHAMDLLLLKYGFLCLKFIYLYYSSLKCLFDFFQRSHTRLSFGSCTVNTEKCEEEKKEINSE